mmetsp:Transcript_28872/g.54597  ORF Transcript_28872/g.54597 Transcript_28872/m.54597 type:complete len:206 (-) Transcript_28872:32-649(-)
MPCDIDWEMDLVMLENCEERALNWSLLILIPLLPLVLVVCRLCWLKVELILLTEVVILDVNVEKKALPPPFPEEGGDVMLLLLFVDGATVAVVEAPPSALVSPLSCLETEFTTPRVADVTKDLPTSIPPIMALHGLLLLALAGGNGVCCFDEVAEWESAEAMLSLPLSFSEGGGGRSTMVGLGLGGNAIELPPTKSGVAAYVIML